MIGAPDMLLALHVACGSAGLVLGPLAMRAEQAPAYESRAGSAYHWSVLGVSLTALGLVILDPAALWWLVPLALLAYGLALLGRLAPSRRRRGWIRAYAHGQGGSYIALVTAALVVSVDGPAAIAAWVLPTLIGVWLIERRVRRLSAAEDPGARVARRRLERDAHRSATAGKRERWRSA